MVGAISQIAAMRPGSIVQCQSFVLGYTATQESRMQQARLIRKYATRRLYDTVDSRHVTLEDLRGLIVAGHRLQVVDEKDGENRRGAGLLQIRAEQDQLG